MATNVDNRADLDEMVFEDRERRYGAYFLRKRYPRHVMVALGIIALLFLVGTHLPGLALGGEGVVAETTEYTTEIDLADLPPPPPVDEEPPPPPPDVDIPPPKMKTVSFKIPKPTPKDELVEEEQVTEMDSLEDAPVISFEDQEGSDEGFIDIPEEGEGTAPVVVVEEKEPDPTEFIVVSEEPQPRNLEDVRRSIGYPQLAKDANIEGLVIVRVLVDKYGNYKKHLITRREHPILAEAVEEHVADLTFTPAIQGGKPIPFWVNIPFRFKLLE